MVTVTREGATTVVTLCRPEVRNAVDRATATALYDAFVAFDADPTSSVAVLTGAGGTFCAGADLAAIAAGEPNEVTVPDAASVLGSRGPMGPTRLVLGKPVIAAVEGYAVAGGLELAVWADLRVVAEDAVLGVFCRRWGVPLIDGGTVRLPRLVGEGRALDLVLTGREVRAEEALAIGLADRIAPPGAALEVALELAESLTGFPQECLRTDRASVLAGAGLGEAEALAAEVARAVPLLEGGSVQRGASGFGRRSGSGPGPGEPRR